MQLARADDRSAGHNDQLDPLCQTPLPVARVGARVGGDEDGIGADRESLGDDVPAAHDEPAAERGP